MIKTPKEELGKDGTSSLGETAARTSEIHHIPGERAK